MLDLIPKVNNPIFQKLLSKPTQATTFENAPETVNHWHFPDPSPHATTAHAIEVGEQDQTKEFKSAYSKVPDLNLYELENVFIYRGETFSSNGHFFPYSARYRPEKGQITKMHNPHGSRELSGAKGFVVKRPASQEKIGHISQPCMKFHSTHVHYGHYLLEVIPLLWVFEKGFSPKLLIHWSHKDVSQYLLDMVAPFGLSKKDFIIPEKASTCEHFFMASEPCVIGNRFVSTTAKAVWQKIAAYYAEAAKPEERNLRLYLSRSKLNERRQFANEQECETIMKKHGFRIIYPEELSFPEQVKLYAHATHIVGSIGSAMHNTIFSLNPDALKVLFFTPENFPPTQTYAGLEAAYGRDMHTVSGKYTSRENKLTAPWAIDKYDMQNAIQQWLTA